MDKAFFGYKAFNIAYEKKAIDTLIITDGYLRKISATVRKDLSAKIKVLKAGASAEVCQFSSLHTTGEKIDEFGGICGILKYIVDEIVNLGDEDNDENEKKTAGNASEDIKDENLIELINDNLINYNPDIEEDQKEEKGKFKKKKTKEESKNISQQKKKFKRKRSSFGDGDDDYDYDDVY